MKIVIGVTGGFGTGKSTVCRFFEELGAEWIEADEIVHRLYEPENLGYRKIKGYFGDSFVNKKGVNRDKLRKIVLPNVQKLWILNKLIHPLVTNEIRKILCGGQEGIFVIESPYFETSDLGPLVSKIIMVRRDERLVKKLRAGKWSAADIEKFIRLQPGYLKPDFVIENNSSRAALKKRVAEVYADLVDLWHV